MTAAALYVVATRCLCAASSTLSTCSAIPDSCVEVSATQCMSGPTTGLALLLVCPVVGAQVSEVFKSARHKQVLWVEATTTVATDFCSMVNVEAARDRSDKRDVCGAVNRRHARHVWMQSTGRDLTVAGLFADSASVVPAFGRCVDQSASQQSFSQRRLRHTGNLRNYRHQRIIGATREAISPT